MVFAVGLLLLVGGLILTAAPYVLNATQGSKLKPRPICLLVSLAGAALLFAQGACFYAEAGHSYMVQYPTGTQVVHTDPGIHAKLWGQLIELKQVLTLKCNKDTKDNGDFDGSCAEIDVQFNDAVRANVSVALRLRLPSDQEKLHKIFTDFRSQGNLMNSTIVPTVIAAVKNSARLLSAQEYVMGRGGEFDQAVMDQLMYGIYVTEAEQVQVDDEPQPINKDDRAVERKEMVKFAVRKKLDKLGQPIRNRNTLEDYGITINQATIERVDPEDKFKDLLGQQRDAAGKSAVARQDAQKAEFDKQRIVAEGEAQKAQIQVDQEKDQVKFRIEAETKQRVMNIEAETQRQVADKALATQKLQLEAARMEAQRKVEMANAEATAKRSLAQANNSLDAKLDAYVKVQTAYANAAAAQGFVPKMVVGSGASTNATGLMDMLSAKVAKDLAVDMGVMTK